MTKSKRQEITKLNHTRSDGGALILESQEEWSNTRLLLLPGPLCSDVLKLFLFYRNMRKTPDKRHKKM